jgi:hypothetical protein
VGTRCPAAGSLLGSSWWMDRYIDQQQIKDRWS